MLECERLLIVKQLCKTPLASNYQILDASSGRPVGLARTKPNKLAPLLGRLGDTRFLPMKLEAFEIEDEPLVFTVRRNAGFLRGQARIADADDHRLGRLLARGSTPMQGFWILDRQNVNAVTGEFVVEHATYQMKTSDGTVLATLDASRPEMLVEFSSALHEQPLTKMLLLGSVFALEMIFPRDIDCRGHNS
jgi:hypothetical protein